MVGLDSPNLHENIWHSAVHQEAICGSVDSAGRGGAIDALRCITCHMGEEEELNGSCSHVV